MDTNNVRNDENVILTIAKQTINDFIHNFLLIASIVSGLLLFHGIKIICEYYKQGRNGDFMDFINKIPKNFFVSAKVSIVYLVFNFVPLMLLVVILQNPYSFTFIFPIIFVTLFYTTIQLSTLISMAYYNETKYFKSLKKNIKMVIVKPYKFALAFIFYIFVIIAYTIPIAYLFLTIYALLLMIVIVAKDGKIYKKL